MPTTITIEMLKTLVRSRPAEGHKGTFGHALLVAGSYGMAGAGILAGRACMRSGVGKLTVHIPWRNNDIMQVALPEAILNHDEDDKRWTCSPFESCLPNKYSAIGIGPGIGREEKTAEALYKTLLELNFTEVPLVLDADALNILAEHPQWADLIPNGTIITPHPLEYRRLVESGGMFGQRHPRAKGTSHHHHYPRQSIRQIRVPLWQQRHGHGRKR